MLSIAMENDAPIVPTPGGGATPIHCDFDPFEDISLAHNGCWRWSSNKTELHDFVNAYFESRREGGD